MVLHFHLLQSFLKGNIMKHFNLRYKLLVMTVVAFFVWAVAADIPFTFKAGDVISSEQMNQNFAALNNTKQDLVTGTCAAGSSIRAVAADGTVTCEVDDIGSGAGDAGVDAINGMTGAVTLQAGDNITIDDSTAGQIRISSQSAGGTTYEADDSSLVLNGTTFSIKDGGVSAAKLANGSVTASKLLPFDATGSYGTFAFSVRNTATPGAAVALRGIGGDTIGIGVGGPVGVLGESSSGIGVLGGSLARGIVGLQGSTSCAGTYAVGGCATGGIGVYGRTATAGSSGVHGETDGATVAYGVSGFSTNGVGVYGESSSNDAVVGVTGPDNTTHSAIVGSSAKGYAAYFEAGNGSGGFAVCSFKAGTTNWSCSSDRHLKENFEPVNSVQILEAVAKLPVTTWNLKGSTTRQMGPTAQDFYSAFDLGESDKTINNTDAQGVALAAIQGLYQLVQEQQAKIEELESQLSTLQGN
jgi:hypothetical protein